MPVRHASLVVLGTPADPSALGGAFALIPRVTLLLLGIALLSIAGCESRTSPNAGKPTVQGESMQRMLADIETIRAYVRRSGSRAEAEAAAKELVSWSDRLSDLFPPDQVAAQYVDLTPAMAREAPRAMAAAATALQTAIRTGPLPAVAEQLERTEHDGCGACHRAPYR